MDKRLLAITTLILGILLFAAILTYTLSSRENIAPEDTSALIDGTPESGYPQAGYMISKASDGQSLCSVTFLSQYVAITAGHCVADADEVYADIGEFNLDLSIDITSGYKANQIILHPNYQPRIGLLPVQNDIAFLLFNQGPEINSGYAIIDQSVIQCGYYMVAYGDSDPNNLNSYGDRKGADICITSISSTNRTFVGQLSNGRGCFGDSGSALFEKGSNRIVGVVSAIRELDCSGDEILFADFNSQQTFIDQYKDWLPANVTPTATITLTPTPTVDPTTNPTIEFTPTPTVDPSITNTPTPTIDTTQTPTPTLDNTPTPSNSPTPTIIIPTQTPTPTIIIIPETSISFDGNYKFLLGIIMLIFGIALASKISEGLDTSDKSL